MELASAALAASASASPATQTSTREGVTAVQLPAEELFEAHSLSVCQWKMTRNVIVPDSTLVFTGV